MTPLARMLTRTPPPQADLAVVHDPAQARSLLDPTRRKILALLRDPGSSSSVAQSLGLPRQRVNYHVREMEKEGLLLHVENRRRGNCVEKIVQAAALRHLLDPTISRGGSPYMNGGEPVGDPFSSATLRTQAIRALDEVTDLEDRARAEGKRPPTLTLEARIHFRSPAKEVEFAREMQRLLEEVSARYHEPDSTGGRDFRIAVTGYLIPNR